VSGLYCVRRPWPGMARTIYGDHEKYLDTYFRPFPGWVAVLAYTEIQVAQVVYSYCNVFQFLLVVQWWLHTVRIKKSYADIRNVFSKCVCSAASDAKRKASSTNWKASSKIINHKVSSKDTEGFFQTVLGSYTHKFLKRGAAPLTDFLELCLCLPSCIGNGKAEQQWKGFHKHESFLKMRTIIWRILE